MIFQLPLSHTAQASAYCTTRSPLTQANFSLSSSGPDPSPSSGMVPLTSFRTFPESCNLCGYGLKGQAAAGREGERRGGVGRYGTIEEASPGVGRPPSTSQAQVNSQQASHPSISAAPTFSWPPQPYLSHQPGPTSNHPPSHLHGNQSFAAPQDVGDKTCLQGSPGSHLPIPGRDGSRLKALD